MRKRIFIAIGLSEPLQKEILKWENQLLKSRPAFAKASTGQIRWLAGKNLHITLVPPWYAEEKEIEKIKNILHGVGGEIRPFEMDFEKVAFGPMPRRPRLIWAEGQGPDKLIKLKSRLENALGQKSEKRTFLLHLTLARFRPEDFGAFTTKALDEKVSWKEKVESFVLMESHLSRFGADYEILFEIKLNAKEK